MRAYGTTPVILLEKKRMKNIGRWVVFGISVLLSSLHFSCVSSEEAEGSASVNNTEAAEMKCISKSFIDIVLNVSNNASTVAPCTGSTVDIDVTLAEKGSLRPKCDEASGCNVPLNCFNFRELGNDSSVIPDPPQALLVTPHQLEDIVETTSVQNCCAVVLFYAPWCTFSVQFARKFNALGRSFDSLPILAVDLAENDPYKYILAYLPLVAFYYRGKTLFKFNLESSFEELRDAITNITGFEYLEVNLTDPENDLPVPTQRDTGDQLFLSLSVWWVVFVALVYSLRSTVWRRCCLHLRTRLSRHSVTD